MFAPSKVVYRGLLGPTRKHRNEQVRSLEKMVLSLPQIDFQTRTLIYGGMCARWIFIPAGTVLTGALTKLENICVVIGDINVTTDDGMRRITGFEVLPATAAAKRAGYAFADTWWLTVWPTDETDATAIENEMTDEADRLQTRRTAISCGQHELDG